jgi:ABC-type uncharacterized transport system permease subunit
MPWVLQFEGLPSRAAGPGPYTLRMILSPATLFSSASLVAAGAYLLAALWPKAPPIASDTQIDAPLAAHQGPAWYLLVLGWLAQALAIGLDAMDWQTAPLMARFGFAPALSVTFWLVLSVYALERAHVDSIKARRVLALLAAGGTLLALVFPGQVHPSQHALAPLHWALGLAAQGMFGASLLHAAFLRRAEKRLKLRLPPSGIPLLRLEALTVRFAWAGFVLLSAALVLGYLFAQPWRWDHKALFSMLSWLVFAVLLAGRHWLGWRGRTATLWLTAGSVLLLLAYVGTKFVLEVILHRVPLSP